MFPVDKHDDIFHLQPIFFKKFGCFQDATSSCNQIIDDECGIAWIEAAFYPAFPGPLWPDTRINQGNIGLQRIRCSQEKPANRNSSHDVKGTHTRTTQRLRQVNFLLHEFTCYTQGGWITDKHLGVDKNGRANG